MRVITRPLSVLLGVALTAASLAAAKPAAAPKAKPVLLKTIKAHKALKPCTMQVNMVLRRVDAPKTVLKATIQWNDPAHYTIQARVDAERTTLYANGGSKIVADHVARKWIRLNPGNPEHIAFMRVFPMMLPTFMIGELSNLVSDPEIARGLAQYPLTTTTINGEKAYRFYTPTGMTGTGSTSYIALAIGRTDSLIRKVAVRDEIDTELEVVTRYTKQKTRFPASTFAFKAPAGYTETDIINDETEEEGGGEE